MPSRPSPTRLVYRTVDLDGLQEAHYAKGYFPHLFNRPGEWRLRGPPTPDAKSYYMPEAMSVEKKNLMPGTKNKLQEPVRPLDFQKGLIRYCQMDVKY